MPGVSLILVHRGEIVFKEAFGNLTVDTQVQMASSSKPVTASLLMILADQRKLSLDDPIEKYLPEFRESRSTARPPARSAPGQTRPLQHVGHSGRHRLSNRCIGGNENRPAAGRPRWLNGRGPEPDRVSPGPCRRGTTERARRGVSLRHHGIQRCGAGGRSGGRQAVRGACCQGAARTPGYEPYAVCSRWAPARLAAVRRCPAEKAGSSWRGED